MADAPAQLPGLMVAAVTTDREAADRWSLALLALGIDHEVRPQLGLQDAGPPVLALVVRAGDAPKAVATLREVEAEQQARLAELQAARNRPPVRTPGWAVLYAELLVAALLGMSVLSGLGGAESGWVAHGIMDAQAVLHGQYHRLFTGVTLHADGSHLLSNLLFIMVVAPTVVQHLGPGWVTVGLFACGAVGNAVSASVHGPGFSNVGASGGAFGLLCMLAVVSARTRQSRLGQNRWLLGVGAGLALLCMLGFGEHSDVVAHLGGFAAAVPVALLAPLRPARGGGVWWSVTQALLVTVGWALPALAWWRAWHL